MGALVKAEMTPFRGAKQLTLSYKETWTLCDPKCGTRGEYQFQSSSPISGTLSIIEKYKELIAELAVLVWQLKREPIGRIWVDDELAKNEWFVQFLQQQEYLQVLVRRKSQKK